MPIVSKVLLLFGKCKNIYKFVLRVIVALFISSLFVALFGMLWAMASVMLSPGIEADVIGYTGYTGENDKPELIKLIGLGISGIIATLGVVGLLRRAAALDEQNKLTEKGHIHERFKAAAEHLGSRRISMRIAAFNEFYRLADLNPEPGLRPTIFGILCAHLRKTTKDKKYKPEKRTSDIDESEIIKPTEEVQNLLNVLFKKHNKDTFIFDDSIATLKHVNLQGANLYDANLKNARLQEANLKNARLQEANLEEAKLQGASLKNAMITENTKMPDGWENVVKQDKDGKTGVLLVDDEEKTLENY